ncbi:hypothetical protein AB0J86_09205 [Micromonospora sp. NPDC049559]|uniref:hypothetical protein n=1 Tax=Micromonospora sp. NPDC049559 TaxID=3155923 RepID=UPI003444ABEE
MLPLLTALAGAGCDAAGPVPPVPERATGPARAGAASTSPATGTPEGAAIDCSASIDRLDAPPPGFTVLAGAVALSTRTVLAAGPAGEPDGSLFAKSGLVVRADAAAELEVDAPTAVRARIGWGGPAEFDTRTRLTGCPDRSGWLVFAGGYRVARPACLTLAVRADGRDERARVPVGTGCS